MISNFPAVCIRILAIVFGKDLQPRWKIHWVGMDHTLQSFLNIVMFEKRIHTDLLFFEQTAGSAAPLRPGRGG